MPCSRRVWIRSFQRKIGSWKGLDVRAFLSPSPSTSSSSFSFSYGELQCYHFHIYRRVVLDVPKDDQIDDVQGRKGRISKAWTGSFLAKSEIPPRNYRPFDLVPLHIKKRRVPVRYVSLGSEPGDSSVNGFSRTWMARFARINEKFDKIHYTGSQDDDDDGLISPEPLQDSIFQKILQSKDSSTKYIMDIWSQLGVEQRRDYWPDFMLWIMQHRPQSALDVLQATYKDPLPPMGLVADCLDFIAGYHLQDVEQVDHDIMIRLYGLVFLSILKEDFSRQPILHQKTLRLMFKHSNRYGKRRFYDALKERNVKIHHHTKLHIIHSLAQHFYFQRALEMLGTLVGSGMNSGTPILMQTCTTLLREAGRAPYGHQKSTAILAELLNLGIRPNLFIYNVAIRNVMEVGDFDVGCQMYDAMKEDGTQPDVFTFSIMLKGAKQQREWRMVDRFITELRETGTEPDAYIINELLHVTHLYMNTRHDPAGFGHMLTRFQDYYSDDILRQMGILPASGSHHNSHALAIPDPPPATISVILSAYLSYCTDWTIIARLYAQYRTQVAARNHLLFATTATDYFLNAFLLYFSKSRRTLLYCNAILDDMLTPSSGLGPPSIYSWTIILNGYMSTHLPRQAEKILELMIENGEKPNQVTWNLIIMGYARLQDVYGVANAVRMMKSHGFKGDSWTITSLSRIREREELVRLLELADEEVVEDDNKRERNWELDDDEDDDVDGEEEKEWKRYEAYFETGEMDHEEGEEEDEDGDEGETRTKGKRMQKRKIKDTKVLKRSIQACKSKGNALKARTKWTEAGFQWSS